MASRLLPAVPDPQLSLESLRESVMALKEIAENMAGMRGPASTTSASATDVASLTSEQQSLSTQLTALQASFDASIAALSTTYAVKSQTDFISGIIAVPTNTDYRIVVQLPYAVTVNSVTTRCTSGTCTATTKINSTALGGTANSVSTTEQEQTHTSSNVAAAGDDIVMTVSSNATCTNMSFTIKFTRTLA